MNDDAFAPPLKEAPQPPSARGRAIILIACVLVYTIACWLPAFHLTGRRDHWHGVEVMVLGPCSLGFGQLGWLANITGLIALRCVMTGRTKATFIFTLLSVALALHPLALVGRELPMGPEEINAVRVIALGAGYYVWIAAMLIPAAAALLLRQQRPQKRAIEL